jgi:hypothetical protein
MNPMFNIFGCVLLIVPEWKPVSDALVAMLMLSRIGMRVGMPIGIRIGKMVVSSISSSPSAHPQWRDLHQQDPHHYSPFLLQVGNAATYNNDTGIVLITSAGRRNGPSCVDSKIHHCNLINNSE